MYFAYYFEYKNNNDIIRKLRIRLLQQCIYLLQPGFVWALTIFCFNESFWAGIKLSTTAQVPNPRVGADSRGQQRNLRGQETIIIRNTGKLHLFIPLKWLKFKNLKITCQNCVTMESHIGKLAKNVWYWQNVWTDWHESVAWRPWWFPEFEPWGPQWSSDL